MDEALFSDSLQLPELFVGSQRTHRHITVHKFGDDWRLGRTHHCDASSTRLDVINTSLKVVEKRCASTQGGTGVPQGLQNVGVDEVARHLSKA